MSRHRSFYSVIQYCPDRFRAEAVNIGLVLYCQQPRFLRARIVDNHRRLRRLFGVSGNMLATLRLSEQNLLYRLNEAGADIVTLDDLKGYVATRANDLQLTEPRLAVVEDFEADFARLFAQLVDEQSTAALADESPTEVLPPRLGEVFYRLQQSQKIWKPGTITVPVYKRKIEIPYAYKNGVVNFVKPHVFPANKRAETQAATLTVNGQLIQKHPIDGEKHTLIVVSTQENAEQAKEIDDHIEPMFRELGVRLVRPHDTDAFADEVEASAH
jgi:hypothetical protein